MKFFSKNVLLYAVTYCFVLPKRHIIPIAFSPKNAQTDTSFSPIHLFHQPRKAAGCFFNPDERLLPFRPTIRLPCGLQPDPDKDYIISTIPV